jgi:hypothetical protein
MYFLPKLNLLSNIIFVFLHLLIFQSKAVFADDSFSIKVDDVMALKPSKQSPKNEGLIAWKYGAVYHLDTNLNVIRKIIENDELTIRSIIQVSSSLYILSNSDIKNEEGEIEDSIDIVIEYDLAKRVEKSRLPDLNDYKLSSISGDKTIFVMVSSGYQKTAKYHDNDYTIATNKQEPILCTSSNVSKLNWKPSICYRKGKFNWEKIGSWSSSTPPFICNNFLVEKNEETKKHKYIKIRNKDTAANISVIDISTGKQFSKQDVAETSPLSCIGTEIIYASNSSIIIRKLPTLEVTHTLITTSKEINSVTMIDDSVYWVDEKGTIHKKQLQK